MNALVDAWYQGSPWLAPLLPLAALYRKLSEKRRHQFASGARETYRAPVPVIVVGNITVGGTGKTPLVIWLAAELRRLGFRPGIISRGYGGRAPAYPYRVFADSLAEHAGDEPLMLARRTGCPLVVDPVRANAARCLLAHDDCDILISDDGLQHYALARDFEIAVLDGARGLGNGQFLPAGPLREAATRLQEVDLVVVNGAPTREIPAEFHVMNLAPGPLSELQIAWGAQGARVDAGDWSLAHRIHAVAGIGNPERFFLGLEKLGFEVIRHGFPDHHAYSASDLQFSDGLPVVMTEKDAVKCQNLTGSGYWFLPVEADFEDPFRNAFQGCLERLGENAA